MASPQPATQMSDFDSCGKKLQKPVKHPKGTCISLSFVNLSICNILSMIVDLYFLQLKLPVINLQSL